MASLTRVAIVSRKSIRYGLYILIFLIAARFLFRSSVSIYQMLFPKPPPPPTVTFGGLPKLPFPQKPKPENISYKLETPEGALPTFIEQLPVYFMPPVTSNIRGLDFAKKKAESMGFIREGKVIAENVPNIYLFGRRNAPSSLTMNIVTGIFSISYDLNSDPTVIGRIPPAPEDAIGKVKSYLSAANLYEDDLNAPEKTQFLKIESGQFVPALSLSESDFIKVSLFRKGITFWDNDFPSLSPTYPEGNVWFMLSGSSIKDKVIIAAEYHYFPIDEEKMSTYPIKTAEVAWEELKAGEGYIVGPQDIEGEITIRRVYLAFYDAGQYTQFYQPVAVFEGDNEFMAFVPAITGEYYDTQEEGAAEIGN